MRCKGMTLFRMPLFVWLMFVISGLTLITITPLTAAQFMLPSIAISAGISLTHRRAVRPSVWIHFFWIFGHPEVYVLVLPAFAHCERDHPCVFAQSHLRLPGHGGGLGRDRFVSVSVWAHHMFTVGMTSVSNAFFVLSTMIVGIPTGIKIFNWIATMWGGKIRFATPMLFALDSCFSF